VIHVAGSVVKVVCWLVSLLQGPLWRSRKNGVPLVVPRIAIQYLVPEAMGIPDVEITFQLPLVSCVLLPSLNIAPGCPLLSVYSPVYILVAVEVESRYTVIELRVPLAVAVA
jgi:hypothetical protein